ncbi:hypothetical protein F5Y14DRAFT_4416 [Nemania sp. NC0429]|nr:hypothetical protein F5Y14DRAFT_4416 [Nemania sp. NC0429]
MEDPPPPPYEEVVRGGGGAVAPIIAPGTQTRLMPLDFNVYGGTAGPFTPSTLYFMGPHQTDKQFALTIHHNSFAQIPRPFIILHDGLTAQDPPVGTATNVWTKGQKRFYDRFVIAAPALADDATLPPVREPLEMVRKGTYWHPIMNMRYSVQVAPAAVSGGGGGGGGGGDERQEFEWQESGSREVSGLGGDSRGWRLVAVADESETLAVCACNGGSLTKFLRFSFRGRGRAAGHFGRTWEVMAVLTGLATWVRSNDLKD